ncbi:MAG: alpha/beta hydrolase [Jatrophihabitantaceae bacterium]
MPTPIAAWRSGGQLLSVRGADIFLVDRSGPGDVPIVILHGFPGSSFDWFAVVPSLAEHRRVIALDLLGYGLSAKPQRGYSLFAQADLVLAVLDALEVSRCVLVAHDMGDTVAAELLHRHNTGTCPVAFEQLVLTNGSIFIDMAHLTRGQRLALAMPNRPLPLPTPAWVLRHSLAESFAPASPPPAGTLKQMAALITHSGGARLLPVQIRYLHERREHQARWTAALVDFQGPMAAIWGELDPIAVVSMPHRLKTLRPDTEVITWPDTGHWPSIEQPERLTAAITSRL